MSQFNPLERKCSVCGESIFYSKADWKDGRIPEKPVCGACLMGKKSGMVDEIKTEGRPFMGSPVIGKRGRPRFED